MPLTEIFIDLYTGLRDASDNVAPEHRSRRRISLRAERIEITSGVRQELHDLLDKNINDLNKELKQ